MQFKVVIHEMCLEVRTKQTDPTRCDDRLPAVVRLSGGHRVERRGLDSGHSQGLYNMVGIQT